jgi:hypothetical protein
MRMVELEPKLFLGRPQQEVDAQVAAADALLRTGLEGADIESMLIEDPALLFEDFRSLQAGAHWQCGCMSPVLRMLPRHARRDTRCVPCRAGLTSMHELWDVDDRILRDSDPVELVLAVRALSSSGPPRTY